MPLPGVTVALAGATSLFATYWDDAWHTDIGRDDALIPPHLVLYGSVAVVGLIVSWWGLRTLIGTRSLVTTLGHTPLMLAGVGGVVTLAAAPLDAFWHATYGRDAVLWSPPHMLVVFASTTMAVGVLAGLRPTRHGTAEAGVSALILGSAMTAVLEYDTDVPQFSETLYLPVLLTAALFAVAVVRTLVPGRFTITKMVAVYFMVRLLSAALLALLGRSTPDLPIAVLGLILADLPWSTWLLRLSSAAAAMSALAWGASATGLTSQPPGAIAPAAVPVIAAFGLIVTLRSRRAHPWAAAGIAFLLTAQILIGGAAPALAHDPGQGEPLRPVYLTGASDGHRTFSMSVHMAAGCDGVRPRRLIARRSGQTVTGALRPVGPCRFAGSLRVLEDGNWFVYAEFDDGGRDSEAWLPLQAGRQETRTEQRELYQPAAAGSSSARLAEVLTGVAIYALGIALLVLTAWQARRARPVVPG